MKKPKSQNNEKGNDSNRNIELFLSLMVLMKDILKSEKNLPPNYRQAITAAQTVLYQELV